MKRQLLTITIAILLAATTVKAQDETYKFDAGLQLGMSGYLGDANTSNIFHRPGFSAGASFRYLANTRWTLRGVFTTASLSGNTADFDNILPENNNFKFNSKVYTLDARFEFNFLPYGIGETYKHLRRISPYITAGIGATFATCDGQRAIAPDIPLGFGVKYKLRPRINLGLEFTMTKVFSDKVDGENLSDPYRIKSSFLKNTDWYSNLSISITYEFGERCVTCHYVD